MELSTLNILATMFFFFALSQSLFSSQILKTSYRFKGSHPFISRFLHFASEPEIIFGLWAAAFVIALMIVEGFSNGLHWLDRRNFSEVAFVFVIMILASSKPITDLAELLINSIARQLPFSPGVSSYGTILFVGPLLGSLITEPAAMTISAILLKRAIFKPVAGKISDKLFYSTLGVLFVNISVGGALTHFSAPPVLMVARAWGWDTKFMFMTFGWKAIIVALLNMLVAVWINYDVLKTFKRVKGIAHSPTRRAPWWIICVHMVFVILCVLAVHHPAFVLGLFIFFLGFYSITKEEQSDVQVAQSLLVGFFLGGLVVLTTNQGWWLKPILSSVENLPLYLGTLFLAPVTDNAAITSLASQVETLTFHSKYLLVAAALVGGGLTIIANAPNPAGFVVLRSYCPGKTLNPLLLFIYGLIPTLIAGVAFYLL